jgi:hypothetical protein
VTRHGARTAAATARLLIRERGNAWLAIEGGMGLIDEVYFFVGGQTGGDEVEPLLSIQQVFRIPLGGPAWSLLLDRKISLDLSLGAFVGAFTGDIGAISHVRVSFYWFEIGPTVSVGSESSLSAGLSAGVHVAL